MGPSGVTTVIIRKDLAERSQESLPSMLSYKIHVDNNSLYNTPNTFGVYIIGLVAKWIREMGGIEVMEKTNKEKAEILYKCIDESNGFYKGHADKDSRSLMNVTFNLSTEDLEKTLVAEATAAGFNGVKGHRSVGGLRASIYNAFPKKGVEDLVEFMKEFQTKHA